MCWLGLRLNIRRCWDLSRFLVQPSALPLHRGSRAALRRRRLRTAGYQRHRQSACRQASGRLLPKTLTTLLLAFGQLTARCVSAWKTPSRVVAKITATGSMHGVCNCAARRAGGTRCLPASIQTGSRTKASLAAISFAAGPSLRRDHWNNRPSDRLQLLSWNPGLLLGLDPSLLASHLNGPWHVVCVQGGAGHDKSLQDNLCIVTQHNCAVVFNKNIFAPRYTCVPLFVRSELKYSTWAVEGMVATGKFRRAPDRSCSFFTVANVNVINESTKRRSVCNASATCVSRYARSCSPVT